jgi:hypothetical protein
MNECSPSCINNSTMICKYIKSHYRDELCIGLKFARLSAEDISVLLRLRPRDLNFTDVTYRGRHLSLHIGHFSGAL